MDVHVRSTDSYGLQRLLEEYGIVGYVRRCGLDPTECLVVCEDQRAAPRRMRDRTLLVAEAMDEAAYTCTLPAGEWEAEKERLRRWPWARQVGATMVEYILILALIAILVIGIVSALGGKVSAKFSQASSGLSQP